MKTIWKFPVGVANEQTVAMPEGAKALSVQVQKDFLCIWAIVDSEAPVRDVTVYVCGTGHPLDMGEDTVYVGTVQVASGGLVWHVFMKDA